MSFALKVKEEIISKPIKEEHCKIAFLSGLLRGAGVLFEKDNQLGVDFRILSEEGAYYASNLLKTLFNYEVREISVTENNLSKKEKFVITVHGGMAEVILKRLDILRENDQDLSVNFDIFSNVAKKDCCLRSFFKGLFFASGNCTVPENRAKNANTGYHLDFSFSHNEPANVVANKLLEIGLNPKITSRKGKIMVYIKSAEEIKDFIAFLPAPISVLALTDLMINKEISNNSNRQKNCDLGNLNRQIIAVEKQILAIDKIDRLMGLKSLKPELLKIAIARKENPEETLLELSSRLGVSKSCLNHRLRKLVCIANEIHEG